MQRAWWELELILPLAGKGSYTFVCTIMVDGGSLSLCLELELIAFSLVVFRWFGDSWTMVGSE
jgi:hypothetical protein